MIIGMDSEDYVIGVDLGGTNVRVAIVSPDGRILQAFKLESGAASGYKAVLDTTISAIERVKSFSDKNPFAIGVASPGAIDVKRGVVTSSPNFPDWIEKPFGKDIEKRLKIPVALDNDGAAAALGERWSGAAKGWSDFIMLTLGTGIGGGIILEGKVWRGISGMAGEVGHINVVPDGRLCGCGSRGCVETYSSATGVARTAREMMSGDEAGWLRNEIGGDERKIDAEMVTRGAESGDILCIRILEEAGMYLGKAIAATSLILDVSKFVIGGGMAPAFPHLVRPMRDSVLKHSYTLDEDKLITVQSSLGDNAGIAGAAKMAFDTRGR